MSDRQAVEELRRKIESHEAAGFSVGFYRNADIRAALSFLHEQDEQLAALRQRWLTDDNHPPHAAPRPEVTEEIVAFAEENARRLRAWYENHKAQQARDALAGGEGRDGE